MSEAPEKSKEKPKIERQVLYDGSVIVDSIDNETYFISFRQQTESKAKGGLKIGPLGLGGEGEKGRKDEWTAIVWEGGQVWPRAVWDEKRREEVSKQIKHRIATVTGSNVTSVGLSQTSGSVVVWAGETKNCEKCGTRIPINARYCSDCGEQQP